MAHRACALLTRSGSESKVTARVTVALLAGLLVFALLFPWGGGIDPDPPTCFGMFGWWTVPCGGGPAVVAGVVTAGVVWAALGWLNGRRRRGAVP